MLIRLPLSGRRALSVVASEPPLPRAVNGRNDHTTIYVRGASSLRVEGHRRRRRRRCRRRAPILRVGGKVLSSRRFQTA